MSVHSVVNFTVLESSKVKFLTEKVYSFIKIMVILASELLRELMDMKLSLLFKVRLENGWISKQMI